MINFNKVVKAEFGKWEIGIQPYPDGSGTHKLVVNAGLDPIFINVILNDANEKDLRKLGELFLDAAAWLRAEKKDFL